jgi:hypothetical protein
VQKASLNHLVKPAQHVDADALCGQCAELAGMHVHSITSPNMRLYDHVREQAVQVTVNAASGHWQYTNSPQHAHKGMSLIQLSQISVFIHFPTGCISQCWQSSMTVML